MGRGTGRDVDARLFDRRDVREALSDHDFGTVFRVVREEASLTQEQLGLMVGLSQARVSAVERGHHRIRDVAVVVRIAEALGIPAPLLGFPGAAAGAAAPFGRLSRRDLVNASIGLVLAAPSAAGPVEPLERFATRARRGEARLGSADVAAVESITAEWRGRDFRSGGTVVHRLAMRAQVETLHGLLGARCSPEVRAGFELAFADLVMVAAWAEYDAGEYDSARGLWMSTLSHARRSAHPARTDLVVRALIQMSHHALHLGRPGDALRFLSLAQTAAATGRPVSALTESYLASNLGWCHAAMGNGKSALRALDEGDSLLDTGGGLPAPPWSHHVTGSERAGMRGLALTVLSREDPRHAAPAARLLARAAAGFGPEYDRTRLMVLPVLAIALLRSGEVDSAVATGRQALDVARRIPSVRVRPRLRALLASADQTGNSDLAHLKDDIRAWWTTG
ncbi:helix-turn-helix domain-containing protein [Saccharothrix texasensis]|uniref:Helix-turn-helix protein n=1 Tax=Saccharothrix texasensis TaxID=103734 RepID=A0A3N1H0N7_9PSEU|nr:helix-turn-helix transcriptional regulator [Saccharothrix texasensis]ROP35832.1 helix-turn-helix protein [Saccharothrix texasensis]